MTVQKIQIFTSQDGRAHLEVSLNEDTDWLSQAQMAELFGKDVRTVNEHISNVYAEGELERGATIRKFRMVRREGVREVRRDIDHYNLDVIISIGYRVGFGVGAPRSRHALSPGPSPSGRGTTDPAPTATSAPPAQSPPAGP